MKYRIMDRKKVIQALVIDRAELLASDVDAREYFARNGFHGYNDRTDEELVQAFLDAELDNNATYAQLVVPVPSLGDAFTEAGLADTNQNRLRGAIDNLHAAVGLMDLQQRAAFFATRLGKQVQELVNAFAADSPMSRDYS